MTRIILFLLIVFTNVLFSNEITTRINKIEQSLISLSAENRLDSLIHLVYLCRFEQPNKGLKLAEEELRVLEQRGDLLAKKGYLLNGIGEIYNRLDRFNTAEKYYLRALSIFERIKDKSGQALVLYNLGYNTMSLRDFKKAGEYLLKSLTFATESNNKMVEADAQSGMGVLNYIVGNYQEALMRSEIGLNIATKINYKRGIALAHGHLGLAYLSLNQYPKSLFHFNENLNYSKQINDKFGTGEAYEALGVYYINKEDYKKALEMLNNATVISEELGLINSLASSYTNIGVAYEYLDNLQASLNYLNKALKLIDGLKDYRLQYYIHRRLSYTYEKLGDYKKALENFRIFKAFSDSVYDNAKNQIVRGIEKEAEASKKIFQAKQIETENQLVKQTQWFLIISLGFAVIIIILGLYLFKQKRDSNVVLSKINDELKLKGTELQKTNDELIFANKEKDKYISILAHDLRSPFFGILGITSVLFEEYDKFSQDEHKTYLLSLNGSLRNLFELLDNLLNYGRFTNGKIVYKPSVISICKIIDSIINIFKFNIEEKNIQIIRNRSEECLIFADQNMMETVLRNLISNAIKFSKEHGKILISTFVEDNFVKVTILDEGIGISDENLKNILSQKTISTKGTKEERGSGMGLELCKEFISINKGKLGIESRENHGTTIWFTVPKNDFYTN
ncbi:MAG TPA: tetratricopeptide repeat protein [Melioribacteraceae bacterium]|nr:tetratricopeptide repeat protein [Melioribacteraceae bacterium]